MPDDCVFTAILAFVVVPVVHCFLSWWVLVVFPDRVNRFFGILVPQIVLFYGQWWRCLERITTGGIVLHVILAFCLFLWIRYMVLRIYPKGM